MQLDELPHDRLAPRRRHEAGRRRAHLGRHRRHRRLRRAVRAQRRRHPRRRRQLGQQGRACCGPWAASTSSTARPRATSSGRTSTPRTRPSGAAWARTSAALIGRDVDIVFEHPGRQTFGASVFACARGGKIVTCAATSGYMIEYDNRHLWMKLKRIVAQPLRQLPRGVGGQPAHRRGQDPADAVEGVRPRGDGRGRLPGPQEHARGQARRPLPGPHRGPGHRRPRVPGRRSARTGSPWPAASPDRARPIARRRRRGASGAGGRRSPWSSPPSCRGRSAARRRATASPPCGRPACSASVTIRSSPRCSGPGTSCRRWPALALPGRRARPAPAGRRSPRSSWAPPRVAPRWPWCARRRRRDRRAGVWLALAVVGGVRSAAVSAASALRADGDRSRAARCPSTSCLTDRVTVNEGVRRRQGTRTSGPVPRGPGLHRGESLMPIGPAASRAPFVARAIAVAAVTAVRGWWRRPTPPATAAPGDDPVATRRHAGQEGHARRREPAPHRLPAHRRAERRHPGGGHPRLRRQRRLRRRQAARRRLRRHHADVRLHLRRGHCLSRADRRRRARGAQPHAVLGQLPRGGATGPLGLVPADADDRLHGRGLRRLAHTPAPSPSSAGAAAPSPRSRPRPAAAGAIGAIIINNVAGPLNGTLGRSRRSA